MVFALRPRSTSLSRTASSVMPDALRSSSRDVWPSSFSFIVESLCLSSLSKNSFSSARPRSSRLLSDIDVTLQKIVTIGGRPRRRKFDCRAGRERGTRVSVARTHAWLLPVALVAAQGCARGSAIDPDAGDDVPGDTHLPVDGAGSGGLDAEPDAFENPLHPDGGPDAAAVVPGTSLLLTEVVLAPNEGEFIELYNPTAASVSLQGYYLTDNGNYFALPAGATAPTSDFIVKFPVGAVSGSHKVVTIAIDTAASFQTSYGVAPTYSIGSGTMTVVSGTAPSLTNAGELVALFYWDGTSDLVKDVDLLLAGVPTVGNGLVDKSGIAQDGPDSGTTASSYSSDARTVLVQTAAPGMALSTKRILGEAGHETQAGTGNGLVGDDETSEATRTTWDSTFTAPTPGSVPAL